MSDEEKITPEEQETSSFRIIATLGVAGFISGLALVGIYLFTLPMIEANKEEALRKAIYEVLPNCSDYKTLVLNGKQLMEDTGKKKKGAEKDDIQYVYAGFDDQGQSVGYAVPAAEAGFQDIIALIYGYDAKEKKIIGFHVLDSKETPGLGDKIQKDEDFLANFNDLNVEPDIVPVKKGQKANPNEMECITGATISSKAVCRILNNAMDRVKEAIDAYDRENNKSGSHE